MLALAPIGGFHSVAIHEFEGSTQLVNKLIGMSLQLTGGLIILYSVNNNLGVFRNQSLCAVFINYLFAFPIKRKPVAVNLSGAASVSIAGSATGSVISTPSSVEERVARLEIELEVVRRELRTAATEAARQLELAKEELGQRLGNTHEQLAQLEKKVDKSAVGGIMLQLFGVLLALYGAVTGVFA